MANGEDTTIAPAVSSVEDKQQPAKPEDIQALVPLSSSGGLAQLPVTEALKGLGRLTNEASMVLLSVHTSRLENDVRDLQSERRQLLQQISNLQESYHAENKRSAVLAQQLRSLRQTKNLQKYMGNIGGIIAGAGIPFLITGPPGWGLAAATVGIALLVAGSWPVKLDETK